MSEPLSQTATIRYATRGMRTILLIAGVLVFLVGIQLYVLTNNTDRYFAWTVNPPLTAAFLGAAYWAACVLEFSAARQRVWARMRCAVPAVLIFTTLTLIITLLHADRFHFTAPDALTRFAAWAWLAVYAVVPPIMAVLLLRQLRLPGGDPPRGKPIPSWMKGLLSVQAAVMLILGVGLLSMPPAFASIWPWSLTPLTGRAMGAWLVGLGVAVAQVIWENDFRRTRPVAISAVVFAVLEFIAMARYPTDMSWSDARFWIYAAFLISMLVAGVYGWRAGGERR